MDPIMVTALTAAGLFATKLLEEAGSQAGKGLSAATGRLVTWLSRRGEEDLETSAALTLIRSKPADTSRVELLAQALAAQAEADPGFAQELRELTAEAKRAGDVRVNVGGAHIHGGVHGHATVSQVGGDQIQLHLDDQP